MLTLLHNEISSGMLVTLAVAEGARTALPLLLLSVPTMILLTGIAFDQEGNSGR